MLSQKGSTHFELDDVPIGILTPTNSPFCNAGPADSTVFPMAMPTPIATRIHSTRNRSRNDSPFNGGRSLFSSQGPSEFVNLDFERPYASHQRTYQRSKNLVLYSSPSQCQCSHSRVLAASLAQLRLARLYSCLNY
jgi:hypothetical protein